MNVPLRPKAVDGSFQPWYRCDHVCVVTSCPSDMNVCTWLGKIGDRSDQHVTTQDLRAETRSLQWKDASLQRSRSRGSAKWIWSVGSRVRSHLGRAQAALNVA
jgi:hypothetical protein